MLGDKQLIVHVFERVSHVTEEIVVSAKSDEQAARIRRLIHRSRVVLDGIEVQTPLVGFLSGLRAIQAPYVFVAACDIPFVEPNVIRLLFEHAVGRAGAVPVSDGEVPQPLCAVYRRQSAIGAAEKSLESKRVSMLDMLTQLEGIVWVSKEELSKVDPQQLTFRNVNTHADLEWAERTIKDLTKT